MNKKAMAIKTLVELIFFAVITLLIALPVIMQMMGFFVEVPETGTTKSLDALAIEMNNIGKDKPITIPVYVDKEHFIKGYKAKEPKPPIKTCEEEKSCLCICNTKEQCSSQDRKMECKSLEFDLKDSLDINVKLDKKDKAIIQNCVLERKDKEVTVSCS